MMYARVAFILLIAGMILLLVLGSYRKSGKKFPWENFLMGAIALGLIFWFGSCVYTCFKPEPETKSKIVPSSKSPQSDTATAPQAATVTTPAGTIVPPGGFTLYEFAGFGDTLRFTVRRTVKFFPKGGPTWIGLPDGTSYIDTPGVDVVGPKQRPGTILVTPADSSATGVELFY